MQGKYNELQYSRVQGKYSAARKWIVEKLQDRGQWDRGNGGMIGGVVQGQRIDSMHWSLCSVQCALCSVHCVVCSVHCIVKCTL